MRGSPELSKLTKAPRFGAIKFRKQTPGSPTGVIAPSMRPSSKNDNEGYLDPTHPATKLRTSAFPDFRTNAFGLKAAPVAFLWKPPAPLGYPLQVPFETWAEKVARHFGLPKPPGTTAETKPVWDGGTSYLNRKRKEKREQFDIPMSFMSATNKKRMGGKPVYVVAIKRKIKMAIRLVVLRGAKVESGEHKGKPYSKVVFDDQEVLKMDGKGWIMPGWSYVFFPTIEVYRMPYPDLVNSIRDALSHVYAKASTMEQGWLKAEEKKLKNSSNPSNPGPNSRDRLAASKTPFKASSMEKGRPQPGEKQLNAKKTSNPSNPSPSSRARPATSKKSES